MTRLLIVDDEPSFGHSLRRALEARGYQVELAESSEDAILVAARLRPEVLVTDWMLGVGLNGVELSAALSLEHPLMRTIVVTGHAASDVRGVDERPEIVTVLEKPFPPSQLLAVISSLTGSLND